MVLYISLPRSSYTNASNEYSLEAKENDMVLKQLAAFLLIIVVLNNCEARLQHPFKQCSRMSFFLFQLLILCI